MTSQVEPYADQVEKWWGQGIQGTTIHQALGGANMGLPAAIRLYAGFSRVWKRLIPR